MVAREKECNLKSRVSIRIKMPGKLNAKMIPPRVFRTFKATLYYRLYR